MKTDVREPSSGLPAASSRSGGWASLKGRALKGSAWSIGGQLSRQCFRLGGNLILTRLLFPEAFGLMGIVQVFLTGAEMFSDVGLEGSVVHHRRGEDRRFLDTAWTVQVVRGVLLWLILCAMTYPVSLLYEQPQLLSLLPVAGVILIIHGFDSTARFSLTRRVLPARQVAADLTCRISGLVVMISVAIVWKSVWALACGALVTALVRLVLSYRLIPGYRNRFAFDRDAFRSQFQFGKWVFLSTACTFLFMQGDRLVLGLAVTIDEIGVYLVAAILAQATVRILGLVDRQVLVPVYSELRHAGAQELRDKTRYIRVRLMALTLPLVWFLAIFGQEVIEILYDDRYLDAGWMLQILAAGHVATIVTTTAAGSLLAHGDSLRQFVLQGFRALFFFLGMAVGGYYAGMPGALVGMAAGRFLEYGVLAVLLRRYGVWMPGVDFAAFGASAVVILLGNLRYL